MVNTLRDRWRRAPLWYKIVLPMAVVATGVCVDLALLQHSKQDNLADFEQSLNSRLAGAPVPASGLNHTTFEDGSYIVGADVEAGDYATAGPASSGFCEVKRLDTTSAGVESPDHLLGSYRLDGPGTIKVLLGDILHVSGCQPFNRAG